VAGMGLIGAGMGLIGTGGAGRVRAAAPCWTAAVKSPVGIDGASGAAAFPPSGAGELTTPKKPTTRLPAMASSQLRGGGAGYVTMLNSATAASACSENTTASRRLGRGSPSAAYRPAAIPAAIASAPGAPQRSSQYPNG